MGMALQKYGLKFCSHVLVQYSCPWGDILRTGRYGDRIPVGGVGEIFRTRSDRLWGSPSLLYSGYLVIVGGKAAAAWR